MRNLGLIVATAIVLMLIARGTSVSADSIPTMKFEYDYSRHEAEKIANLVRDHGFSCPKVRRWGEKFPAPGKLRYKVDGIMWVECVVSQTSKALGLQIFIVFDVFDLHTVVYPEDEEPEDILKYFGSTSE